MPSNVVLPNALKTPGIEHLRNKRVVLASASPRREEILREQSPIDPEIHEHPVATTTQKAVEVYQRLVEADPDDPPVLVIGADTIVFTHALPATALEMETGTRQELLEKPTSRADNLRMLLDVNGGVCEVVSGVSLVYPILTARGYAIRELDERSLVYFAENHRHVLEAYVENGEGIDRAGGFAVQGLSALLIRKIDGDYNNVMGFHGTALFKILDILVEEEDGFLTI
ncbi:Maf Ham1 [Pisolithus sp. B1]|nr:Maf Ham1 [Pisolithus sp. B1]